MSHIRHSILIYFRVTTIPFEFLTSIIHYSLEYAILDILLITSVEKTYSLSISCSFGDCAFLFQILRWIVYSVFCFWLCFCLCFVFVLVCLFLFLIKTRYFGCQFRIYLVYDFSSGFVCFLLLFCFVLFYL